jgi:hypothetical protein
MKSMGVDSGTDSLYGGGSDEAEPKGQKPESVDQENEENAETALVPMKILQGKSSEPVKEGDTCTLKVVAVHGEECEVAFSESETGEKTADSEIDEMDSKDSSIGKP